MTLLHYTLVGTPDNGFPTETSHDQEEVEDTISQRIRAYQQSSVNPSSLRLEREAHQTYLRGLLRHLPASYVSLDASRPWLIYWIVHSLAILSVELDATGRQRAISTLAHCRPSQQSPRGGFGGGPGQRPHLATTYAAVLALAIVGDERVWSDATIIDRRAMHEWMLTLKQADGSFIMHEGGEVDIRGAYCALTVATLLNILTPDLTRGTAGFAASCQTFEGGLASSCYPSSSGAVRPPLGEAHGGYAFCALATYFLLLPVPDAPGSEVSPRELDVPLLLRWAAQMQGLPIEGGGFRGRTNKLVDGCYSWWDGGLWSMLGALLRRQRDTHAPPAELFEREALQEYILLAAQEKGLGGLRDKPGKPPDGYHTCYNLSGLSAAQHQVTYSPTLRDSLRQAFLPSTALPLVRGEDESEPQAHARMAAVYAHSHAWREEVRSKKVVGDDRNEVVPVHPIFNITNDRATMMLDFFYGQPELVLSG